MKTTTPTMQNPQQLSPMTRERRRSKSSASDGVVDRKSPRPHAAKEKTAKNELNEWRNVLEFNGFDDYDDYDDYDDGKITNERTKERGEKERDRNARRVMSGKLPDARKDLVLLSNSNEDEDDEDTDTMREGEEEEEVFEDAGNIIFEESTPSRNNRKNRSKSNAYTAAAIAAAATREENSAVNTSSSGGGALNRAMRRELYELTKSRDEVSIDLDRARNEFERVEAMRRAEMEAMDMHKRKIADAAQATAKEANRVEIMKEEVKRRERRCEEEMNEAKIMRDEANKVRVEMEKFLERQSLAEIAERKAREEIQKALREKEMSQERMEDLERKQEQVSIANAACEREAILLKRDYERFEKNRRELARQFAKREFEILQREELCLDKERRAERAKKEREEEEQLASEFREKRDVAEKHLKAFMEQLRETEIKAKKIEDAKNDATLKMKELDSLFLEKKEAIERAEHALKKAKVEREQIKEELDARERHTAVAAEAAAKECDVVAQAWAKVTEGRKQLDAKENELKIAQGTIQERLELMKNGDEELDLKGSALEKFAEEIQRMESALKKDREEFEKEKQNLENRRRALLESEKFAKSRIEEIDNREMHLDTRENDIASQLARSAMVEENLKMRETELRQLLRSDDAKRVTKVRDLEIEVDEKTRESERLRTQLDEATKDVELVMKKMANEMDVIRESFRTKEIEIEAHRKALENQLNESRRENRDLVSEAAEARKERESAYLRLRNESSQTTTFFDGSSSVKNNVGTSTSSDNVHSFEFVETLKQEIVVLKQEISSQQTHREHLEQQLAEARQLASANSPSGKTKKETERRKAWEASAMRAVREARDALDARAETVKKASIDVKKREENARIREKELVDGLERVEKEYAKARAAVASAESERIDVEARREYIRREQLDLEKNRAVNDAFKTDEDLMKKKLKAVRVELEDAERKLENATHLASIRKQELNGLDLAKITHTKLEDLESREAKIREFTDKVHPALLREAETLKETGEILQQEKDELQNSWLELQNREKVLNDLAKTNNERIKDLKEFERELLQEREELIAFRDGLLEQNKAVANAQEIIQRATKEKNAMDSKRSILQIENKTNSAKTNLRKLCAIAKKREDEANRKLERCARVLVNCDDLQKSLRKLSEARAKIERDFHDAEESVSNNKKNNNNADTKKNSNKENRVIEVVCETYAGLCRRMERTIARFADWFNSLQSELENVHSSMH